MGTPLGTAVGQLALPKLKLFSPTSTGLSPAVYRTLLVHLVVTQQTVVCVGLCLASGRLMVGTSFLVAPCLQLLVVWGELTYASPPLVVGGLP